MLMSTEFGTYFAELLGTMDANGVEIVETTANVPSAACQRTGAEGLNVVVKLVDDILLDFERELPGERHQGERHDSREM